MVLMKYNWFICQVIFGKTGHESSPKKTAVVELITFLHDQIFRLGAGFVLQLPRPQ